MEDCIVLPKKSIYEMVARGELYRSFGVGVGGVVVVLDDEVSSYFL